MSNLLDFGPIYNPTGTISQIEYATKAADNGSTLIAIKSNYGAVIAVEKPRESKLIKNKENKRITHLGSNIYTACTGILSDFIFIKNDLKQQIIENANFHQEMPSPLAIKTMQIELPSLLTRYFNTRPMGINFITTFYNNGFYILKTDCNSKTSFYKAVALGKGAVRAKTELEKVDFSEMQAKELAEYAVKVLYKSYDPVKDKEFDIELCYMNESTGYKMVEISEDDLNLLVEQFQHLSVD